jgi:hypothetical protein
MAERFWENPQSKIEQIRSTLDNLLYNFFQERTQTNRAWAQKQAFLSEFNQLSIDDKKIYLNFVVDNYLNGNCWDAEEFKDLVEWMSGLNKMEIYATLRNACSANVQQPNTQQNWNWGSPVIVNNNIYNQVPSQQQLETNDTLPSVINMQIISWRLYWNWDFWQDYDRALQNIWNIQINRWDTKTVRLDFKNRSIELTVTYWNDGVMYFEDNKWRRASYFIDQMDDDRWKKLILWRKVPDWSHWNYMELDFRLNLSRQRHYQPVWPWWRRYHNPPVQWWAEDFYWRQFRNR